MPNHSVHLCVGCNLTYLSVRMSRLVSTRLQGDYITNNTTGAAAGIPGVRPDYYFKLPVTFARDCMRAFLCACFNISTTDIGKHWCRTNKPLPAPLGRSRDDVPPAAR